MPEEKSLEERAENGHRIGLIPGHCFYTWWQDRKNGTCVSGPVSDFIDVTIIEAFKTLSYINCIAYLMQQM